MSFKIFIFLKEHVWFNVLETSNLNRWIKTNVLKQLTNELELYRYIYIKYILRNIHRS